MDGSPVHFHPGSTVHPNRIGRELDELAQVDEALSAGPTRSAPVGSYVDGGWVPGLAHRTTEELWIGVTNCSSAQVDHKCCCSLH